jgi:hypothetical protein
MPFQQFHKAEPADKDKVYTHGLKQPNATSRITNFQTSPIDRNNVIIKRRAR